MCIFVPDAEGIQPHQRASITYKVGVGTANSIPRLGDLTNIRARTDSGSKEIIINGN
jgi:hypothetical protein